jgi:membrane protease YdiL (CAAX protease family)
MKNITRAPLHRQALLFWNNRNPIFTKYSCKEAGKYGFLVKNVMETGEGLKMEKKELTLGFWKSVAIGAIFCLGIPLMIGIILGIISGIAKVNINYSHPLFNAAVEGFSFWIIYFFLSSLFHLNLGRRFSLKPFFSYSLVWLIPFVTGASIILSECDNLLRHFIPMSQYYAKIVNDVFLGRISLIGSIIAVVIVAPVVEEILFRGIILNFMQKKYTSNISVILSALIFALVHLNIWQFFGVFILGLIFGWLFVKTNSLWLCIAGHMLNNSMFYIIKYLFNLRIPGFTYESEIQKAVSIYQPLWFDLLGVILVTIGLVGLMVIFKKKRELPIGNISEEIESLPN